MSEKKSLPERGKVRVKKKTGRSHSSNQWLKRQLNDPYVRKAHAEGYRSARRSSSSRSTTSIKF